ncbi:sensor domain-containing diguanylate cyclase [Halalkalibacter nanhaiisediminis]|uniref:PAS domain S-box-containing protein/diguanylate cyclase (GGDEF)-like protein n=1 Tax=Halalkalibacter nanhaiisediminis TaxID=688079 RepID=A0A562QCM2_9BACI|nr:GGDEF domain-containing protein [Halalkalibacter nanhaiisediminis]TWI54501.1 PAS domain S-box-containing protein/diguanylate cyclase (GGDEF)-like protein [Halalkalibacter nanhaiisediminis]
MISYFKSEQLFERAFHYSAIGIALVDLDNKCLVINEAFCEMLGYNQHELVGKTYSDVTHPADLALVQKARELVLEEGTFYQLEKRYVKNDGAIIWGLVSLSLVRDEMNNPVSFIFQVQDITLRKETERQLTLNKERWKKILETVPNGIVMLDLMGKIIFANERAERILRFNKEDILMKEYNSPQWKNKRIDGSSFPDEELPFSIVVKTKKPVNNVVHTMKGQNGTHVIISVNATPISDEHGELNSVLYSISDITSQKMAEQQLLEANLLFRKQSQIDGLTGVANRRYFNDYFEDTWDQGTVDQTPISLILFDLDHFKLFNDTYGHQSGDDCLREVTVAVDKIVKKEGHLLARYGGEEFAIILSNTHSQQAQQMANDIKKTVEELQIEHAASEMCQFVTISVGVATVSPHAEQSIDSLICKADQALYQAKSKGRNVVQLFIEE